MSQKIITAGALSDIDICQLIDERFIKNAHIDNVKPSSLDLQIDMTSTVEVPCVFLPSKNKSTIEQTLKILGAKKVSPTEHGLLRVGKTYVVEVVESINLSQTSGIFARANPKSSTGRVDIHIQLLADYAPAYDTLPEKWTGKLYALLRPKSFDIYIPNDLVSLNQIRFFQDRRILVDDEHLRGLISSGVIKNSKRDTALQFSDIIRSRNRVELSLDLRDLGDTPGYISKKKITQALTWEKGANDWKDFFEPLEKISGDKAMIFQKDRFYILSSREAVKVPREYACEMISFDDTLGEFRSHYAGFIDNGWGESSHRPLTLELRTNEDMYMYHGQPVAHIVFDQMSSPVRKSYDEIGSNYIDQNTARLGKFFK